MKDDIFRHIFCNLQPLQKRTQRMLAASLSSASLARPRVTAQTRNKVWLVRFCARVSAWKVSSSSLVPVWIKRARKPRRDIGVIRCARTKRRFEVHAVCKRANKSIERTRKTTRCSMPPRSFERTSRIRAPRDKALARESTAFLLTRFSAQKREKKRAKETDKMCCFV